MTRDDHHHEADPWWFTALAHLAWIGLGALTGWVFYLAFLAATTPNGATR